MSIEKEAGLAGPASEIGLTENSLHIFEMKKQLHGLRTHATLVIKNLGLEMMSREHLDQGAKEFELFIAQLTREVEGRAA